MLKRSPFRYFKTSPDIIRLAVMMYVPVPQSIRNVEDLLHERSINVSHEAVGDAPLPAHAKFAEIRRRPRLRP